MLKALRTVLDLLSLARGIGDAAGTAREVGLRAGVFMLLVVVAGLVALAAPMLAVVAIALIAEWILVALDLDPRPFDVLWATLFLLAFFIGMFAAASVMYRGTRPRSILANAATVDDAEFLDEESAGEEDPGGQEIDPAWLRAIDARLAVSQETRAVGPRADRNRVLSSLGRTARRTTSRFRRLR